MAKITKLKTKEEITESALWDKHFEASMDIAHFARSLIFAKNHILEVQQEIADTEAKMKKLYDKLEEIDLEIEVFEARNQLKS